MLSAEPYGYYDLVDYRDPGWLDRVRGITGEKGVDYELDCISEGDTVRLVVKRLPLLDHQHLNYEHASGTGEPGGIRGGYSPSPYQKYRPLAHATIRQQ